MLFEPILIAQARAISKAVLEWLRERQAGPETQESLDLKRSIEAKERIVGALREEIDDLELQRLDIRRNAKESWWRKNREAFIVNAVAGVVVGIPFLILGVALGAVFAG